MKELNKVLNNKDIESIYLTIQKQGYIDLLCNEFQAMYKDTLLSSCKDTETITDSYFCGIDDGFKLGFAVAKKLIK